jgi:GSCFA family
MPTFRTTFDINIAEHPISYTDKILMLGSCFVENMGKRFQTLKYQALVNPFGVIYNPASMAQSLQKLANQHVYTEADIFEEQGVWRCLDFHSRFSSTHKQEFLDTLNQNMQKGRDFLNESTVWVLTFGTSWVYAFQKTTQIVNNCHKIPAAQFNRFRLSINEIQNYLNQIYTLTQSLPNRPRLVCTLSPIRHLKDGLVENQLSKSALLLALHTLREAAPETVAYFPAYELLLDDLRDYRFYASDMIHPSETAIDYIWERWEQSFLNAEDAPLRARIEKLQQALSHRPFNPDTASHRAFLSKQAEHIQTLEKQFPFLNFEAEKAGLAI